MKYMLGFLSFWVLSITVNACYIYSIDHNKLGLLYKTTSYLIYKVIQGSYLIDPLTGRCSPTKKGKKGISAAQWFDCDKLQIYINRN